LSFALLLVCAAGSASDTTTEAPSTTTVAPTTTTVAVTAAPSTTTVAAASITSAPTTTAVPTTTTTTTTAPTKVFTFPVINATSCTKEAVLAALTNCTGVVDIAYGTSPALFCTAESNTTASCAAKLATTFVDKACPASYAAMASMMCEKTGDVYFLTNAAAKIGTVGDTVKAALAGEGVAPVVACDTDVDFARRWLQAADPKSRLSAIFDGVCLKSGANNCWANYFALIKSSSAANVAIEATKTSACESNACPIAAAGLFATYFPAPAGSKEGALMAAIADFSKFACVSTSAMAGYSTANASAKCGGFQDLNSNIVLVANKIVANANSLYFPAAATTTVAPAVTTTTTRAVTAAAATTTGAPVVALITSTTTAAPVVITTTAAATETTTADATETTTAAATETTTAAATETTTASETTTSDATTTVSVTAAPTTTTVSVTSTTTVRVTTTSTVAATTVAATTMAATTTTTTVFAYPWVALFKDVKDTPTACSAINEYNKLGCCGVPVGRASALLASAVDTSLATATAQLNKVFLFPETNCPGVNTDPFCSEGTKTPSSVVTVTIKLNGVTCTGISHAVVAPMGQGMQKSFVAARVAPTMESVDVSICSISSDAAQAKLSLAGRRRRLQAADGAITVKGTAAELATISTASTNPAALVTLNNAVSSAVSAGAAAAKLANPTEFAKFVDTSKLSVDAISTASIGAVTTEVAKSAVSTYTTPAPAAAPTASSATGLTAAIAPVCAAVAMFASA